MEDEVHLELGEDALEQPASRIEPRNSRWTSGAQVGVERREVERDDRAGRVAGEPRDEAVADLAAAPVMKMTGLRIRPFWISEAAALPD